MTYILFIVICNSIVHYFVISIDLQFNYLRRISGNIYTVCEIKYVERISVFMLTVLSTVFPILYWMEIKTMVIPVSWIRLMRNLINNLTIFYNIILSQNCRSYVLYFFNLFMLLVKTVKAQILYLKKNQKIFF